MPYTLYLKDKLPTNPFTRRNYRWSDPVKQQLATHLTQLLGRVCAGQPALLPARALWVSGQVSLQPGEAIVYFYDQLANGLITSSVSGGHSSDGATYWFAQHNAMRSEVYLDRAHADAQQGLLIANLGFHEFMHNKLDAHPTSRVVPNLHAHPSAGLAHTPVASRTPLTPGNITLLQPNMSTPLAQDTRGL